MEGHLEVPNEENVTVPQIEKPWKSLYFRIKEGRFQWFAVGFFLLIIPLTFYCF